MKCERKGRHFSWSFILDASRYFLVILISLLYSSLILAETCEQHEKCRQEFKLDNNFLTYYTTHKINLSQTQIKRLVIVVYGALRNGHEYFDDTAAAAEAEPGDTAVVDSAAPVIEDDSELGDAE